MNRQMLAALLLAATVMSQAAADDAIPVLNANSFWRWRVSWRKPVVPVAALKAAGQEATAPAVLPVQRVPFTSRPDIEMIRIPPPPAGWAAADFDDSAWPRSQTKRFRGGYFQVGVICMRGRFRLADPKAVKSLKLAIKYRGGVVVYLNGREVARGGMPEGKIDLDTPATPQPLKAWVDRQGEALPHVNHILRRIKAGEKALAEHLAARDRVLEAALPVDALRGGVNVLAVANHRGDYHPVALKWFRQSVIHSSWRPLGIRSIALTATGRDITPAGYHPRGLFVWNLDLHDRIGRRHYGEAAEKLHPIRITGARNGSFAGWVGVSSASPIAGLTASVGDLKAGGATIPASAVDVRYVLESDGTTRFNSTRRAVTFDLLSATPAPPIKLSPKAPPVIGDTRPVWVRVNVPADARAGDYRGELRITAGGAGRPVVVPVELHVADWPLPGPLKFRTHAGIYQSPTSLAMRYNVDPWSEAHWKLMNRSFALLSRAGNDLLVVPVVDRTQFGNDEGMVRWIRKPPRPGSGQADGSFDYDLATLDRFLALAAKHLGVPTFVALQVWHAGGWRDRGVDQENTVTVVDPETGKRRRMQVPKFATPESKKFWAHALTAIRGRLAKAGMDKSACLGILSDSTAPKEVFQMFSEVAPGVGWMRGCHGHKNAPAPYRVGPGSMVVYHEHCYGMTIPNPAKKVWQIWNQHGPPTAYFRSDFDNLPPRSYRAIPERALYQGKRGFGRMGLDYWLSPLSPKSRKLMDLFNRWPTSTCSQRRPTLMKLAAAAPDGPAPTVRFELLLEGLQEAEAMIVIAEALDTAAAKLGPELAAKCRKLRLDRINRARILNGYHGPASWDYTGWQDDSRRIYETAAEVSAKLGRK